MVNKFITTFKNLWRVWNWSYKEFPQHTSLTAVSLDKSWAGGSSFISLDFWVRGMRPQNHISLQHDKTLQTFLPGAVMFKH